MKFRIGLVAFIILVAVIGVAAFLFLPKGSAKNGIYFNTYEGVYAKITGSVRGNANSITLSDLTYSEGAKPTASELASWQVNLEFGEEDEITITINVENKNTNSLYVIFKDDKQTINNVTKTILNDGRPYTSGKVVLLLSDTDTTLFTITFRRDQDVITSIRYNYHIELKAEVTDADIQDGSIEAEESSGYTYEFNNKKNTATITGLSASNTETNLVLPNMVEHDNQLYLITTIGNDAFKNKTTITSVTIPNTVTELKRGVFEGCTNLTSVTIPTSVTKLGSKVFKDCSNLITIELPNTISSIGTNLFSGCTKLTNYNIPTSLTSLGSRMFENCTRITEFTFPTQITTLGDYVFNGLSFETLTIPDTITTLTENSFSGITNIGELTIPCEVTRNNNAAGSGLFKDVGRIQNAKIIVTTDETRMGYAFFHAAGLEGIEISKDVTSLSGSCFENCSSLISIIVDSENEIYDSRDNCNAIIETASAQLVRGCQNTIIPDGVSAIQSGAFSGCTGLTEVVVPNSVLSIGSAAFSGCSGLVSMTLPFSGGYSGATTTSTSILFGYLFGNGNWEGGTNIRQRYVYNSNAKYATYWIPNSIKQLNFTGKIFWWSFSECSMIENITIADEVTEICVGAFYGCSGLKTVTFGDNPTITKIGNAAFQGCSSLQSIDIPQEVTSIVDFAFWGCSSLKTVSFSNGSKLTGIGEKTFNGCSSLENLTLPFVGTSTTPGNTSYGLLGRIFGNNQYAGGEAIQQYYNTLSYQTYYIPSSLKRITVLGGKISYGAFYNCYMIEEIMIGNDVEDIGDNAFYGTGIELVTSGNGRYLGNGDNPYVALMECIDKEVSEFVMNNNTRLIASKVFSGCTNLESVQFSENLKRIGMSAFSGCTSLNNVVLPNGTKTLGNSAFSGCTALTNITLPDSIETIGQYAFSGCSGITEIYIPNSLKSIGSYAFKNCTGMNKVVISNLEGWLKIDFEVQGESNPLAVAHNLYINDGQTETLVTDLVIPGTIERINVKAFRGCTCLRTVYIPDSVLTISPSDYSTAPFNGCSNELVIYTNLSQEPSGWTSPWNRYGSNSSNTLTVNWNTSFEEYQAIING